MESPDLNKLRRSKHELPYTTIQQQIVDVQTEIAELENRIINEPDVLSTFLALDPSAQEAQVRNLNASLPPENQYSIEEYIAELKQSATQPSLKRVRLEAAKLKLDKLLRSASASGS